VTAVIFVDEATMKLLAAPAAPKVTAVAPVKFVPVIVTVVPPVVGPEVGVLEVTLGLGVDATGLKLVVLPLESTVAQKLALGHDTETVT
jgi:hypothetical protein